MNPRRGLLLDLAGQVGQQVVAVDVHLERRVADLEPGLELVDDVGVAGGGEERRQPVVVLDDLVGHRPGRDLARPADQLGDAEGALPVGVLLAAERRHRPVRPRVHVRPVVGRVDDDRVLGDAELVEQVEEQADVAVVVDHRVVVLGLPRPGLADALRLGVGEQVHVGGVHPHEERRVGVVLAADEVDRGGGGLVVDRLHALLRQRHRCPRCAACRTARTWGRSSPASSSVAHEWMTPRGSMLLYSAGYCSGSA